MIQIPIVCNADFTACGKLIQRFQAPTLEEVADQIKEVLESAKTLIGYNVGFDLGFVSEIYRPGKDIKIVDVMLDFARQYGEWNDYFGDYKWQKLTTAARYYHYEFKAHDSMNDVFATLYVYQKMQEQAKDRKKKQKDDTK